MCRIQDCGQQHNVTITLADGSENKLISGTYCASLQKDGAYTATLGKLRQHRIIIVVRLRSQIFRQIVQIERRWADAHQAKFVQDDGKYASKRAAKALDVNCAVLP